MWYETNALPDCDQGLLREDRRRGLALLSPNGCRCLHTGLFLPTFGMGVSAWFPGIWGYSRESGGQSHSEHWQKKSLVQTFRPITRKWAFLSLPMKFKVPWLPWRNATTRWVALLLQTSFISVLRKVQEENGCVTWRHDPLSHAPFLTY